MNEGFGRIEGANSSHRSRPKGLTLRARTRARTRMCETPNAHSDSVIDIYRDSEPGVDRGEPRSAIYVQDVNDSRYSAIHITSRT